MKLIQKFIYVNGSDKNMRIFLEPWGEQFEIVSGGRAEILLHAPDGAGAGVLEFEQLEEGLIVYGYEGCVIDLKSDGNDLLPSNQIK